MVEQWANLPFLPFMPIAPVISDPAVLATDGVFDVGHAPTMLAADGGNSVLFVLALSRPGGRGCLCFFASSECW